MHVSHTDDIWDFTFKYCTAHTKGVSDVRLSDFPFSVSYPGTLSCTKWDCNCTFTRQRGCCCAANDMYSLEDETFMRMKNIWHRIAEVGEKVEEYAGKQHL